MQKIRHSPIFLIFALLVVLYVVSCRSNRTPSSLSFDDVIAQERNPQRLASQQLVNNGRKKLQSRSYAQAQMDFSRAMEIDSQNPYASFYLAHVRYQTGQLIEAAELYQRAADLFKHDRAWKAEAMAWSGNVHRDLQKYAQAKIMFKHALNLDPRNERARKGLDSVLTY